MTATVGAGASFKLVDIMKNLLFAIIVFFLPINAVSQNSQPNKIGPFFRHEIIIDANTKAQYYFSPSKSKAPLVLIIGGSGCTPIFTTDAQGRKSLTIFGAWELAARGDMNVLLVEKPFAGEPHDSVPGSAIKCSADFNKYFTAETWGDALSRALITARQEPNVEQNKTLIFGTSEGAVMAALLAKEHHFISHLVLFGVTGTSQAFDFIANAYLNEQTDAERKAAIDEVTDGILQIRQDPNSSTKFIWGHPYKRWTSFFAIALDEAMLRSKAKIYILSAMQDKSVPALSTEVAVSRLLSAGRDVTVRRLDDTGHSMMKEGQGYDALDAEVKRAIDWFLPKPAL